MARLAKKSIQLEGTVDYSSSMWREMAVRSVDEARAKIKAKGDGDLCGELIKFPCADSYATYVITKMKPFTVAHVADGDAWTVHPAMIRGLRLADAQRMVGFGSKLAALFAARGQ